MVLSGSCTLDEEGQLHLHVAALLPSASFVATPLRSLPVALGGLALRVGRDSLATGSPLSTEPEAGFLTLDQTRTVHLVGSVDPALDAVPMVGAWVAGVTSLEAPEVWSACLRFVYATRIHDRAMLPPSCFLLALYLRGESTPRFYEVGLGPGAEGEQPPFLHSTAEMAFAPSVLGEEGGATALELFPCVEGEAHREFMR